MNCLTSLINKVMEGISGHGPCFCSLGAVFTVQHWKTQVGVYMYMCTYHNSAIGVRAIAYT